jgi:hypothetical protein
MKHYVLIDHNSGYVWDEVDADTPIDACRKVDEKLGAYGRVYEAAFANTISTGYHVFEAPADWTPVSNGQSQAEIERVSALPIAAVVTYTVHSD